MLIDPYVSDKLRELEAELTRHARPRTQSTPAPVLGSLARTAGRALRRFGEGLESWSSPAVPESNGTRPGAARPTTGSTFKPTEEGC